MTRSSDLLPYFLLLSTAALWTQDSILAYTAKYKMLSFPVLFANQEVPTVSSRL